MRKRFGFGYLLLLIAPTVNAQPVPKLEFFGGYSAAGFPGAPRFAAPKVLGTWNNGWQASAKLRVSSRLGLVADFAGQYGSGDSNPAPSLLDESSFCPATGAGTLSCSGRRRASSRAAGSC